MSSFFCAAALLLSACSSALDVRVPGGSAAFESATFSTALSPSAERLSRSFSGAEAVFDRKRIEEAFAAIDFPSPASVRVEGSRDERLYLEFGRIDPGRGIFLALEDGGTKAFNLNAEERMLLITLSRETVAKTVAALPSELFEYVDLLMAPVLTGERLTEKEYIDLIGAAYGPQVASELEACSFLLTVQCPARVLEASAREFPGGRLGGRSARAAGVQAEARGNEARFSIPAVKLFALSSPMQLDVRWGG